MFSGMQMTTASAERIWQSLSVFAGNLSGQSVPGYRGDSVFTQKLAQTQTAMAQQRAPAFSLQAATNFTSGSLRPTGRQLDVAIDGAGWLVVQDASGKAGLTRNGLLSLTVTGEVLTGNGARVMGQTGPLTIPAFSQLTIGSEGSVNIIPAGSQDVEEVGRIRFANPPEANLIRSPNGLFRLADGSAPVPDPRVKMVSGALEESNVDLMAEYLNVVEAGKTMDLHVRMLSAFDQMAGRGNELLNLTRR
ncbi:flagellar hook-basal body complex protein [Endozoicomonas sp. GU-1]|uniref:flagellar hook-basal body complex protein n=2 Tax=Endozoicomonas sp. GU-1 TaxID=3009078 RepID=UPI0022B39D7D|nr:flagellar hook-basal body complex protein [Endozoicomonas sp. GU-1]WBA82490.1 flagellar hook-basal body complex protein [Endozoicomonas sp. GU-1]